MRLFPALFRKKMPGGHIFRGKYRLVKKVTKEDLDKMRVDFENEQRNMFFLMRPYLTTEQSSGHAKALGKQETRMQQILSEKKKFYDNVTIESRLGHLRYTEAWD